MSLRRRPARSVDTALAFGAGAGLLLSAADDAGAVTRFQRSAYTAFALSDCLEIKPVSSDGAAFQCPGLPGYPIYVAQIDGRTFLSAGPEPQGLRAAAQSLGAFNTPFAKGSKRATIEWRFVIRDGRRVPYAIIVRYFTALNRTHGHVFVVTRIAQGEACHAAYIDADANEQAIVIARRFADDSARTFDCATAPRTLGQTGESPM